MIHWQLVSQNKTLSNQIAKVLSVDPITAQILLNRDIRSIDQANEYLNPSQTALFSKELVAGIWSTIQEKVKYNKKILIYGDYDVDGMTSTTMMMDVLLRIGAQVSFKLPDRFKEGYGLNKDLLPMLKSKKIDCLITLDCGITDTQIISEIVAHDIEVIIFDHHSIPDQPPPAQFILNPKALDAQDPNYMLCTAGIVYKFIESLERYELLDIDSSQFLDCAALGTVADVVPLNKQNRRIVKKGLIQLEQSTRNGIKALIKVAELKRKEITPRDIGFGLAPRLNAAGRLAHASIGVELLSAKDKDEAFFLADKLQQLNKKRQIIGQEMVEQAHKMVEEDTPKAGIVVAGFLWHEGVIGITAAKLTEKWKKPAVVISYDDREGKGSARTYGNINVYNILKGCEDLFVKFGGHKEAAGFSIPTRNIDRFAERFNSLCQTEVKDKDRVIHGLIDAKLKLNMISMAKIDELIRLEPFGEGNKQPVFLIEEFEIIETRKVGKGQHVKFTVCDQNKNNVIDGIGFNLIEKVEKIKKINKMVVHLEKNEWNGQCLPQLNIIDIF